MLESLLLLPPLLVATEDWVPIAPPALCAIPAVPIIPPILASGSHLDSLRGDARTQSDPSGPALAFTTFLQIVEDDARARGTHLEIQRDGGGALVRGEKSAVLGARVLQESLDKAGRALDIDLSVRIAPTPGSVNTQSTEKSLAFHRRVRSGDLAFFGTRDALSYIAGFDVEVAAQSGSSNPTVGRALSGRGLHLVACRVAGGERVFLWGVFDVADLAEVVEFDPGTPDLGVLQEPRVVSAQATFSGTVDALGKLEITLRGTPLATPDWTLEIQAQTTQDSALDSAATDGTGFAVIDLGFSSMDLPELSRADPGTLLREPSRARALGTQMSALPPSAVAALVEATRGPGGRSTRPALYWSDRILLVPRSDAALLAEARALVRGVETARLGEVRVELGLGTLAAALSACTVAPARLVVGSERPLLSGYRLEVAPQIWMPTPIVETLFDGACFDLATRAGAVDIALWTAASGPIVEATRENAQVGKLQLASRRLRSGTVRIDPGTSARLEVSGTEEGVATLRCERR